MKSVVVIGMLLIGSYSHAEQSFTINGREGTKLEALKALIANPEAKVVRCNDVELTEKATLKNKSTRK